MNSEEEDVSELKDMVGGFLGEFERIMSLKEKVGVMYRSDHVRRLVLDSKKINQECQSRQRPTRQLTDQDKERDLSNMWCVKSFRTDIENTLNSAVHIYRKRQKEIDELKKMTHFDKPFSMSEVAVKYDVPYYTPRHCIHVVRGRQEAHARAQTLTSELEKVIVFESN